VGKREKEGVTRRSVFQGVLGSVALGVISRRARAASATPVVETLSGKVRGTSVDGVNVFKGIPYGTSTAGANRFVVASKPAAWTGVRDTVVYGPMAEQRGYAGNKTAEMRVIRQGYLSPESHQASEDCLVLNVWTPALDDRKRPVMFWCHGGGFLFGMGDCDWCDGANLARKHNVVVVSVNHRVGVFGFLHLADLGGERFADSGNVGMLDLVAALRWVRDNIAGFGGDARNVTAFGCSGGGSKVSTLLAMPAAQGLFHKAIVQSGSFLRATTRDEGAAAAQKLLAALNLKATDVDQLQTLPPEQVLDAVAKSGIAGTLGPVVDGRTLLGHPFAPGAPVASTTVPMIIGTTHDEARFYGLANPSLFELDEGGLCSAVADMDVPKEHVDAVIESYRTSRSQQSPSEIYFAIATDKWLRKDAITQAERKAAQAARGGAPVYMYLFNRGIPDGRYRAGHTVEIPFAFDNLTLAPGVRGNLRDPRDLALARQVSDAWVAFARSGDPNHRGMPDWKPYELKDRATLVFNHRSESVNDPMGSDRQTMAQLG
jgi:para-nitrobenzyl esterase